MNTPSAQIVVGLGELLWDCFPESRRPGGAPANVAFHAAQLGHRGVVCSRVGNDPLGHEIRAYLADHGLETQHLQIDPARPTGQVTVDCAQPGHPRFTIHEDAAWDGLEFTPQWADLFAQADAVCFGTLAQRNPRARETVYRCVQAARRARIVYDVNLRQDWFERQWIERSLVLAGVVKLNLDEMAVLADLLELGKVPPVEFAAALRTRYAVETVCITRGAQGCMLINPDEVVDLPGEAVTEVDAVGAGDAFTAALISADLRGWSLRAAGRLANRLGALVAGRRGAMPALGDVLPVLLSGAAHETGPG